MSGRICLRRSHLGCFLPCAILLPLIGAILTPHPVQAAARYASIVVDHNTGKVLYARNADARRYPASLTKMMTLYLLFEFLEQRKASLSTRFVVTPHAASQPPSKLDLKPGQSISAGAAIRALVTKSANDVAVVVAENLAGTEENFARLMTRKARALGMNNTVFRNASGLPDNDQISTARDMATLSRHLLRDFPKYYGFFRLRYFQYGNARYKNHNALLFDYRGTDGIKTGYTRASGFNLAASVRRGDKHVVAVMFGGKSANARNAHVRRLLEQAWPHASDRAPALVSAPPVPLRKPLPALAYRKVHTASMAHAAMRVAPPQPQPRPSTGGFHIQIGAFSNPADATQHLSNVRNLASDLLQGHQPLTLPLPRPDQPLYRARFAGFSEPAAHSACGRLQQLAINCIVKRAE